MKKILLIATGGTIASSSSDNGLTPTFDAEQLLSYIPEIRELCRLDGISAMSVDSTNMTPRLMKQIAETIFTHYSEYDGFVVTHGTDTMGYTSAALSYMLQNIRKPVVVTGSQLAIENRYTDAKINIGDAIRFALEGRPGIFVAFDGRIICGTRASKQKTRSFDAFSSINSPCVATIKLGRITYNPALSFGGFADESSNRNSDPFILKANLCEDIFLLKISPGMKPEILDFVKKNYKGVILEGFGIGGIPSGERSIVSKLEELIEAGVAVVVTTQCLAEGIDLNVYEVGRKLTKLNVINAGNMCTEAIVLKLMWALGNFATQNEVKSFIESPVLGDRQDENDYEAINF